MLSTKTKLASLLFFLCFVNLYSQSSGKNIIDSLKLEIKTKKSTELFNIYVGI